MADERDELDEILDGYNPTDLCVRARTIRARERKLAELAHAMEAYLDTVDRGLTGYEASWVAAVAEACK